MLVINCWIKQTYGINKILLKISEAFDMSLEYMGESFQDYSWIQDFEADFPQKVSLKMLN